MKTLYITRHAKSSWEFPNLSDHERPLLEKGKKRTKKISNYLIRNNIKIDLIISSHAVRAYETAKIIAKAIQYPVDNIRTDQMIYYSGADNLAGLFFDISENINSAMIVGHNPTFTNFANQFLVEKIDWLQTSGIVCLSFDTNKWEEISAANCKTNFVIYPKMFREEI